VKALVSLARAEDLPLLRELAKDQNSNVRDRALEALISFSRAEDLPLLRELAKDQNSDVRDRALKALASFQGVELLPLLRELAKDQDRGLRTVAVSVLGSFSKEEDLSLLQELALAPDDQVAAESIRGLVPLCSRQELVAFLDRHDQELCAVALAALDEVLYMPEWMKTKNRKQDREGSVEGITQRCG
jgi:HEAT repeat protein